MTQAEKLEALVRKAVEGGWEYRGYDWRIELGLDGQPFLQTYTSDGIEVYELEQQSIADVLFDHDFARALFQDYDSFPVCSNCGWFNKAKPDWHYHLQQAVISEDPIDYLYQAVFKEKS